MKPEQLRQLMYREPFEPFRVRLNDGRSFDIKHPKLSLVGESVFIIGIPAPDDPNPQFYEHQVWVPLRQIDRLDHEVETATPTQS